MMKTMLFLLCLIFGSVTVPQARAADAPAVTFSLSRDRIVAGAPVFLNYTISNPTASRVQEIWLDEKPTAWLEVRLTDANGKNTAPPLPIGKDYAARTDYGKRVKYKQSKPHTVLFLKPGSTMKGRIALTSLSAAAPKAGTYQVRARVNYRWAEAKTVAELAVASPDFVFAEANMGSANASVTGTAMTPPSSLFVVDKEKTLRLTVLSVDPADLKERAKTLCDAALTLSGPERRAALEEIAAWPQPFALEVWCDFSQKSLSRETPDTLRNYSLTELIKTAMENCSPTLLPFLADLTWANDYNARTWLEMTYVRSDAATQKKILQIYADHHEEFPEHPTNY